MELSNPNARRVLAAGCVCGLLASLTLPWAMLSSGLFALTSVVLAAGCALLCKERREYARPIKPAVAAAVAFVLGMILDGGSLVRMPVIVGIALLYFAVAYYADAVLQETGTRVRQGGAPRPPKVATRFEIAAGTFALALLVGDVLTTLLRPAQLVAMVAMGIGFVQLGRFVLEGPRKEDNAG